MSALGVNRICRDGGSDVNDPQRSYAGSKSRSAAVSCHSEVCVILSVGSAGGAASVTRLPDELSNEAARIHTLLGGATAAWPLVTRAQQPERIRRIALFPLGAERDPEAQAYVRALRQSLEKLGWIDGQNIRIDIRWESGDAGRMQADVAAALGRAPDIIVSGGTPVTRELRQRTRTIPIVFVNVGDPLESGLVQRLVQPGGNVTGFTAHEASIGGKWVELLKEIAPRVNQVLVIVDPENPTGKFHLRTVEAAAQSFAMPLTAAHVRSRAEIERAIDAFAGKPNVGMIVLPSPFAQANRELTIALAAKNRFPAVYASRLYVTSGGLISYSSDWVDQYRQAASYVDRTFKGAQPTDLPIQQPTKYELVINLQTAKALGLDVPLFLQQRADEVIE
jgi:putative tryptophan/tyrosine transport system substrate-binding protein